ncbi:UNVERIFIED_CONTAM: uncharacterized protein DUF2513 [Acetivibrio alkalicellulosi]
MKRDMDLIIKILEFYESREEVSADTNPEITGYEKGVVAYHIRRMYEAGLLDAEAVTSSTTKTRLVNVIPFGLTWEGHEFLDSMRQKGVGKIIRKKLGETLSHVPFLLIKELALSIGREKLGI